MADSPRVNINLIGKPKNAFNADILRWGVNVGRVLVVATELVALGALAYRFYIDRKIIDLHDQIKKEQLYVVSQAAKEENYRSIQGRLDVINKTETNTKIRVDIMNNIIELISEGTFSSTSITIEEASIKLEGVAFSIVPINNFIETLKKNENVTSISLDDISSAASGIQFKLTVETRENKIL